VTYLNCGDWVDSCTAVLEHGDGRMELLHWGAEQGAKVQTRNEPAKLAA
jgi:hypothetical protein